MDTFVFQCKDEECGVYFTPDDVSKKGIVMGLDALHVLCPKCGSTLLVSKFEDWPMAIHGVIPKGYEEVDE